MFLHTRLKVRNLERAVNFYSKHFGMICRTRKTSGRGTQLAFMTMPGSPTELELAFLPWDPEFALPDDIFHLAFRIEDMTSAIEKFQADGIKITEEPSPRSEGGEMAFIEDPDGYEIELLSYSEAAFAKLQQEIAAVR